MQVFFKYKKLIPFKGVQTGVQKDLLGLTKNSGAQRKVQISASVKGLLGLNRASLSKTKPLVK